MSCKAQPVTFLSCAVPSTEVAVALSSFRSILLPTLLTGVALPLGAQSGTGTAGIAGRVLDAATRTPVPHAIIEIRSQSRQAETDSTGRFRIEGLQPQIVVVYIRSLGYEAVQRSLNLFSGRTVSAEYLLVTSAVALPDVTVTGADPRGILELSGFEDRRRMGMGQYYTEAEISRHLQRRVSDLLRDAQGMRIARGGSNEFYAVSTRQVMTSIIPSRNRTVCFLDIFLDGMVIYSADRAVRGIPPPDLNYLVPLSDLVGVEVYTGIASVPAEYRRQGSSCGAILFWTHRGKPPGGDPPGARLS